MPFTDSNNEEFSKLHIYTKTAPALLENLSSKSPSNSTQTPTSYNTNNNELSSTPKSTTSESPSTPQYHGLPSISADLQARVLAFQEKRQAATAQKREDDHIIKPIRNDSAPTMLLSSSALNREGETNNKTKNNNNNNNKSNHHYKSLDGKLNSMNGSAKKITPPLRLPPSLPRQQQQKQQQPPLSQESYTSSSSSSSSVPSSSTPSSSFVPSSSSSAPSSSAAITTTKSPSPTTITTTTTPISRPSMVLPNSTPTITNSSPSVLKASPQAAARLPRSRPSLSQRRGMKLNVKELSEDTNPDKQSNNNNNNNSSSDFNSNNNNNGKKVTSSKMITSSNSDSLLDTQKKPVSEFIGQRGQLSNPDKLPKLHGLFANYSKYIDIKSGSLNFNGKASLHSKGVDFSGGSSFRISIDELEFIEELGRGNYGTVSEVLHKPTNIIMAMKEVRLELDESKFRQILMELEILHNCDSDYIVDFYGAFFVEGAVYMCIEYMNLGSLDKIYQGGIPEPQLLYIAKCVIKGLKQLKDEQNIIHRDVKPTNILVNDQGKIKLCDFGVSGNLVASMARTNIGCQSYMAPERIKSSNPDDISYSVQSDIWSLGLTLLEVANGEYPLISENIFSQLKQIVEDDPPKLKGEFSQELISFVSCCLLKDPQHRPTYLELLQHPWLLKYDDDLKSEEDLKLFLKNTGKI